MHFQENAHILLRKTLPSRVIFITNLLTQIGNLILVARFEQLRLSLKKNKIKFQLSGMFFFSGGTDLDVESQVRDEQLCIPSSLENCALMGQLLPLH